MEKNKLSQDSYDGKVNNLTEQSGILSTGEGRFPETRQMSIILRQVHPVRVFFNNAELDDAHSEKSKTKNKRKSADQNFRSIESE
jgi:hypothetical protein